MSQTIELERNPMLPPGTQVSFKDMNEKLFAAVSLLKPKDGDTILFQHPKGYVDLAREIISQWIDAGGLPTGCQIVVLPEGSEISIFSGDASIKGKSAIDELNSIRATLMVNFGDTTRNKYGFKVTGEGKSVHGLMIEVLEHLTKKPK